MPLFTRSVHFRTSAGLRPFQGPVAANHAKLVDVGVFFFTGHAPREHLFKDRHVRPIDQIVTICPDHLVGSPTENQFRRRRNIGETTVDQKADDITTLLEHHAKWLVINLNGRGWRNTDQATKKITKGHLQQAPTLPGRATLDISLPLASVQRQLRLAASPQRVWMHRVSGYLTEFAMNYHALHVLTSTISAKRSTAMLRCKERSWRIVAGHTRSFS